MHFVKVVGIPVVGHEMREAMESAVEVGFAGEKADALRYPKNMRVDGEDPFAQRAEVEN